MDYSALWEKHTNKENPFRTGWNWILSAFATAIIGALPLLLYIALENLMGSSGGNPIGLGLLAMVAVGLGQLCVLVALGWIGYGIIQRLSSPTG